MTVPGSTLQNFTNLIYTCSWSTLPRLFFHMQTLPPD